MQKSNTHFDIDSIAKQVLGYLNYSSGTEDPVFLSNLNTLFANVVPDSTRQSIHCGVQQLLQERLREVKGSNSTFRDCRQAEQALDLTFNHVLQQYRRHHQDLLFHQDEEFLFNSFFVGRVFEAVLSTLPDSPDARIIAEKSIARLNDYIGHRPVAALESQKIEAYSHEWVRPIPVYVRGAGVANGRYRNIIESAINLLFATHESILESAQFDPNLLDELAIDPRAFDFDHPINKRPNHHFGQWDENHIDGSGRFRRFVVHQVTLDALATRLDEETGLPQDELVFEAGAVLAGTILMASGISGRGPGAFDSETTLGHLLPVIAAYRDTFYQHLLSAIEGEHLQRLEKEMVSRQQPFGGARQHLNAKLAARRANQLVRVHLSTIYARMGNFKTAEKQIDIVPVASARMQCQIDCLLSLGKRAIGENRFDDAIAAAREVRVLLLRAIECGALVDPWNIIGFDANYSLFPANENSVRDHRVDELVELVEQIFGFYSHLWSSAAAADHGEASLAIQSEFRNLVEWWRKFAAFEVSSVDAIDPAIVYGAAENVAQALNVWHKGGASAGDVEFWARHASIFDSAKAHSLVIDALLDRGDTVASRALLVHWLGHSSNVPLNQGDSSFHYLATRWIGTVARRAADEANPLDERLDAGKRLRKFYDYLEANADDQWNVPDFVLGKSSCRSTETPATGAEDDEPPNPDEGIYDAAWVDVVYRDTTDDGIEGSIFDEGLDSDDEIQAEVERIEERLEFHLTLAYFWRVVAAIPLKLVDGMETAQRNQMLAEQRGAIEDWLNCARRNRTQLDTLLDSVHGYRLPATNGDEEGLFLYDRHRLLKESLLERVITVSVETDNAIRILTALLCGIGLLVDDVPLDEIAGHSDQKNLVSLFAALLLYDHELVQKYFPDAMEEFHEQQLLYVPTSKGGDPHQIVDVRSRQDAIRELLSALPSLGLICEPYELLNTAFAMERNHTIGHGAVTEFDDLFKTALSSMIDCLIRSTNALEDKEAEADKLKTGAEKKPAVSARAMGGPSSTVLFENLEHLTESMLLVWLKHSRTLRLSVLEKVSDQENWKSLVEFIETYGDDLFTQRFLNPSNVRAILHQGVDQWFEQMTQLERDEVPKLIRDLDESIPRAKAAKLLTLVLDAIIENYGEFRDYNSTTTVSDQGNMLHTLLRFLKLRCRYDRVVWHLRPVVWAHETLVFQQKNHVARMWRRSLAERVGPEADRFLEKLKKLQQESSIQLETVSVRLSERFVHRMHIDRLRSLVRPAAGDADHPPQSSVFDLVEHLVESLARRSVGVGLELPVWLAALEEEVQKLDDRWPENDDAELFQFVKPQLTPIDQLAAQIETLPRRQ